MIYQSFLKRFFDLFLVVLSLPLILPIAGLVSVLVRAKIGAPVFFVQERPGLLAKPFNMVKFRTMTDARNIDGDLLADEDRITAFGKFLRKTSLDELPEFWNILKGDMSFVGPRPLLMRYLKLYSKEQMRRHDVRPGLTGLAQINGRNLLSWEKKFKLDLNYIDKCSFMFDTFIMAKTLAVVLSSKGVSATDEVTTSEFRGSKNI